MCLLRCAGAPPSPRTVGSCPSHTPRWLSLPARSERDATSWSRKRLTELIENLAADNADGECVCGSSSQWLSIVSPVPICDTCVHPGPSCTACFRAPGRRALPRTSPSRPLPPFRSSSPLTPAATPPRRQALRERQTLRSPARPLPSEPRAARALSRAAPFLPPPLTLPLPPRPG